MKLAIGSGVQGGHTIYIDDEKGRELDAFSAGSGPNDGLKAYTDSTVSVSRGNSVYDEKGRQKGVTAAQFVPAGHCL
jgi:hypothetical protein